MPPLVIDVQRTEDARDVVHRAVQAIAEGKLVLLPTDTHYYVAASGLNESAIRKMTTRFSSLGGDTRVELAVRSVAEAYDFFPELPAVADRLARRCWPGPLVLELQNSQRDSVIARLPEATRGTIDRDHRVALRAPSHSILQSIQRLTAGPLILQPASRAGEEAAATVADALNFVGGEIDIALDDGRSRYPQGPTVVSFDGDSFNVVRAGAISERNVRRMASFMIAVVCTGNTCRSPMGETLLRKQVADRLGVDLADVEEQGVLIVSAGVAAHAGDRASDHAVTVMRERGLDLQAHESRPFDERTARYADLILTMTRGHRQAILQRWPDLAPRVFTMCHDGSDVGDPVGGPIEAYRRCADQIEAQLAEWVQRIDLRAGG